MGEGCHSSKSGQWVDWLFTDMGVASRDVQMMACLPATSTIWSTSRLPRSTWDVQRHVANRGRGEQPVIEGSFVGACAVEVQTSTQSIMSGVQVELTAPYPGVTVGERRRLALQLGTQHTQSTQAGPGITFMRSATQILYEVRDQRNSPMLQCSIKHRGFPLQHSNPRVSSWAELGVPNPMRTNIHNEGLAFFTAVLTTSLHTFFLIRATNWPYGSPGATRGRPGERPTSLDDAVLRREQEFSIFSWRIIGGGRIEGQVGEGRGGGGGGGGAEFSLSPTGAHGRNWLAEDCSVAEEHSDSNLQRRAELFSSYDESERVALP
ncbi:hypothetical protein R1flu_026568 [Riccia fluitans]|uniref:Uncharacterized protein n=1 Tax=Riccia fluitans TaxID=41844 RepID=A0ABD1XGD4_9MARC